MNNEHTTETASTDETKQPQTAQERSVKRLIRVYEVLIAVLIASVASLTVLSVVDSRHTARIESSLAQARAEAARVPATVEVPGTPDWSAFGECAAEYRAYLAPENASYDNSGVLDACQSLPLPVFSIIADAAMYQNGFSK